MRPVEILENDRNMDIGIYELHWNAKHLVNGMYVCQLKTTSQIVNIKIIILFKIYKL